MDAEHSNRLEAKDVHDRRVFLMRTLTTSRLIESISTPRNSTVQVVTGGDASILCSILIIDKREHTAGGA